MFQLLRRRPGFRRAAMFFMGDLITWSVSLVSAFLIRFDGVIPRGYLEDIPLLLLLFVPVRTIWHWAFRLYKISWRSVGLPELMNLAKAAGASTLTIAAGLVFLRPFEAFRGFPRSVLVLDFVLAFCGVSLVRIGRRILQLQFDHIRGRSTDGPHPRLLVVGAGAAGIRLVQAMEEFPHIAYRPVGFIDDDPAKWGTYMNGLRVFGGRHGARWFRVDGSG